MLKIERPDPRLQQPRVDQESPANAEQPKSPAPATPLVVADVLDLLPRSRILSYRRNRGAIEVANVAQRAIRARATTGPAPEAIVAKLGDAPLFRHHLELPPDHLVDPLFHAVAKANDGEAIIGGSGVVSIVLGRHHNVTPMPEINLVGLHQPKETPAPGFRMVFEVEVDGIAGVREPRTVTLNLNAESAQDVEGFGKHHRRADGKAPDFLLVPLKHGVFATVTPDGRTRLSFRTEQDLDDFVSRRIRLHGATGDNADELFTTLRARDADRGRDYGTVYTLNYTVDILARAQAADPTWKLESSSRDALRWAAATLTASESTELVAKIRADLGSDQGALAHVDLVLSELGIRYE